MSLSICCAGDSHFKQDNSEEVERFIKEVDKYLTLNKPDLIVSLGDLLNDHGKVNVNCMIRATDYLHTLVKHAETYVLVGNHDLTNPGLYLQPKHWMYPLKNVNPKLHIVDYPIAATHRGIKLVFTPYVADGKLVQSLNRIDSGWRDAKCIFAHQTVDGARFYAQTVSNVEYWKESYPMCISGHIHYPMTVSKNFIYVGSSLQLGDQGRKRLLLLNIDEKNGENIDMKDIHLNVIQNKTVNVKIEEINNFIPEAGCKIRLKVESSETDFKKFKKSEKYKELTDQGVKIDPVITHEKAVVIEKLNEQTDFTVLLESHLKGKVLTTYQQLWYGKIREPEIEFDCSEENDE